jgi:DNA-binding GntR family transcriptional regulator
MSRGNRKLPASSVKGSTRRDMVAGLIRRDIITGVLKPGEVIRDSELAERYGVSTSPVREALSILSSEFLVIMPPNSAKFVAPLDKETTLNIFAIYATLSEFAFKAGIYNLEKIDIAIVKAAQSEVLHAIKQNDLAAAMAGMVRFFDPIFSAARNPPLKRMLSNCTAWLARLTYLLYSFEQAATEWEDVCASITSFLERADGRRALRAFEDFTERERIYLNNIPLP